MIKRPKTRKTKTGEVRLGVIGSENKWLRVDIVGVGNMGTLHAHSVLEGKVPHMRLTDVCDSNTECLEFDPEVRTFTDSRELIRSVEVDAVVLATPHYSHTTIGIDALENGLHVTMEKPISVHKADCGTGRSRPRAHVSQPRNGVCEARGQNQPRHRIDPGALAHMA
jgi:hypothetical protein